MPIKMDELEAKLNEAAKYEYGSSDGALKWIESNVVTAIKEGGQRAAVEAALLRTLAGETTRDAREFLCRQLRIIGTEVAVPVLAKLLPDRKSSHPARLALGSIGGPKALDALTKALKGADVVIATGIVTTLGDHAYSPARAAIVAQLERKPSAGFHLLVAACVRALGILGDATTLNSLEFDQPTLQAAALNGLLRAAGAAAAAGHTGQAERIYHRLYQKSPAAHVRIAGLRGLLAVKREETLPALEKVARGDDGELGLAALRLLAEGSSSAALELAERLLEDAKIGGPAAIAAMDIAERVRAKDPGRSRKAAELVLASANAGEYAKDRAKVILGQ